MPATVYLSLGSNQERERHLGAALAALRARFGVLRTSSVYESEADGQPGAPPYYNLAVTFDTAEAPEAIQIELKAIERQQGRVPTQRAAHCPLDIDFLFYGQQVLEQPGLVLPRPGLVDRAYVLAPLAELAPALRHPLTGERVDELWMRRTPPPGLRRLSREETSWPAA